MAELNTAVKIAPNKHVDYYDATLFGRAYDRMKTRDLTEGQTQHAALVVG